MEDLNLEEDNIEEGEDPQEEEVVMIDQDQDQGHPIIEVF